MGLSVELPADVTAALTTELTADARRIAAAGSWFEVRGPAQLPAAGPRESGWHRCADLLTDLPGWQSRIGENLRGLHEVVHPSVPATYLMGFYLDAVCRIGALWFGLCGRVPDLSPESLWLRISSGGWPEAGAVSAGPVAVLPGDALAGRPEGVRVLPGRTELLAEYHRQVSSHATRFHDAFRPEVRIGSRQRLGMLDDVIESCLWSVGDLVGDPFTAAEQAEALVGANPRRIRRSCCFAYRLDPALLCHRCPRRR